MNRLASLVLFVALTLAGCAPAATSAARPAAASPAPVGVVATSPAPTAPPAPAQPITVVPDSWWLLDPEIDGVPGTSTERSYRELLSGMQPQRTVVVAILDSGVDVRHEDLDDNRWVNVDEIPANGIDDDGNGYVDDVHGWNFLGSPDGRNVHHDTYEVTRLYVECRERGELDTPACSAIENDLEARRTEALGYLQQYRSIAQMVQQVTRTLQLHLGVDSLTRAAVAAIQTPRPDIRQAQQLYLQMYDAGATPEELEKAIEALNNQLEYGLNPEFDPRPIVGDDYHDGTERYYGNSDVEGPDATHGTHVAGIAGAERNNALGINGIASGVQLMSVRTVPDGDERDKDIANAIRYAVDNGADIINMSFGKSYSPGKALVDEAVRYAESEGVLLIHAAGNDAADLGDRNSYPNRFYETGGQAELWIEVGASGWDRRTGLAAPFSNYGGGQVDVFAPGMDILSTVPGDAYEANQGTSMAAPVVSGIAALIMAYHPELTAADVKRIILDTSIRYPGESVPRPGGNGVRVPFENLSATGGVVNAYAALQRAAEVAASASR